MHWLIYVSLLGCREDRLEGGLLARCQRAAYAAGCTKDGFVLCALLPIREGSIATDVAVSDRLQDLVQVHVFVPVCLTVIRYLLGSVRGSPGSTSSTLCGWKGGETSLSRLASLRPPNVSAPPNLPILEPCRLCMSMREQAITIQAACINPHASCDCWPWDTNRVEQTKCYSCSSQPG